MPWGIVRTDHDRPVPSTATKLGMVTQPAGAVAGSPFTTQPAVRLLDAGSAPVLQSGVTITVAKHAGVAGTLSGQAYAVTDSQGIATFSGLAMSQAESGVSLDFASTGLTGVTSATFTVSASSGVSPILTFEPDQYADTAALLAAKANWHANGVPPFCDNAKPFVAVEDINVNASTVTLETAGGGYGGRAKFMRYNFPGSSAIEVTIGRLFCPPAVADNADIWFEVSCRFAANFGTAFAGNPVAIPAYKHLFGMTNGPSRFQQVFVFDPTTLEIGDPGNENRAQPGCPNIFDNAWHLMRIHYKRDPVSGLHRIDWDGGAFTYNFSGNTGASGGSSWYGQAWGRNSNRGFSVSTYLDWGHGKCFAANPGWGI